MVQTFKTVKGIDRVDHKTSFQLATDGGRATRNADCPLNLRQKASRLEIRKNFFSNRINNNWNLIPSEVKNARTVTSFKRGLKKPQSELGSYHIVEERSLESRRICGELALLWTRLKCWLTMPGMAEVKSQRLHFFTSCFRCTEKRLYCTPVCLLERWIHR